MEDLGLRALHRRVAGIDVHRMLHVVTALIEQADGSTRTRAQRPLRFRNIAGSLLDRVFVESP